MSKIIKIDIVVDYCLNKVYDTLRLKLFKYLLESSKGDNEVYIINTYQINGWMLLPIEDHDVADIIFLNPGGKINKQFFEIFNSRVNPKSKVYSVNNQFTNNALSLTENIDYCLNSCLYQTYIQQIEAIFGTNYSTKTLNFINFLPEFLEAKANHKLILRNKYNIKTDTASKSIGVFLKGELYRDDKTENYFTILHLLSQVLAQIAIFDENLLSCLSCKRKTKYNIYLISLDNTQKKDRKNDYQVAQDLKEILDFLANVILVEDLPIVSDIPDIFYCLDFTICFKYEAKVLSDLYNVPSIVLYPDTCLTTISNNYPYAIKLDVDEDGIVKEFDTAKFKHTWDNLVKNSKKVKYNLQKINAQKLEEKNKFKLILENLIYYQPRRVHIEHKYFDYLLGQILNKIGLDIASYVIHNQIEKMEGKQEDSNILIECAARDIINNGILHLYNYLDIQPDQNESNLLSKIILLNTTNTAINQYTWGLEKQIFTKEYSLKESVKWIMQNIYSNTKLELKNYHLLTNPVSTDLRKFNLNYYKTEVVTGLHRSGWQYVVNGLNHYHNPEGIIFDPYGDRTFGWEADNYRLVNKIPLKQPWVAVFHHTPNTEYSENNLVNMFNRPEFKESLPYCKGIIALSSYVQDWIISKITEMSVSSQNQNNIQIPVLKLFHPTQFVEESKKFTWNKFIDNPDRKVVQIGAWLRDTYAIYNMMEPNSNAKIRKAILKGKCMENYFAEDQYLNQIQNFFLNLDPMENLVEGDLSNVMPISRSLNKSNKYLEGLYRTICDRHQSVEVIEYLENEQYDSLLSKNIVFIKLVDASACNTIIECIVRNTPILVNRLPAVEEYLGAAYPLYYTDLQDATRILSDLNQLKKGYEYLRKMDKSFLKIETFIDQLLESALSRRLVV